MNINFLILDRSYNNEAISCDSIFFGLRKTIEIKGDIHIEEGEYIRISINDLRRINSDKEMFMDKMKSDICLHSRFYLVVDDIYSVDDFKFIEDMLEKARQYFAYNIDNLIIILPCGNVELTKLMNRFVMIYCRRYGDFNFSLLSKIIGYTKILCRGFFSNGFIVKWLTRFNRVTLNRVFKL